MAKADNKNQPPQQPVPKGDPAKAAALQLALAGLEKQYGAGTVMKLGENAHMKIDVIPSDILAIDIATGVGGIPKGRVVEIYGPESGGKTTLALHYVAACQRRGGTAAFVDVEHALDPQYAKALGVDIGNLLVSQPDNGEQALEITEALVASGAVDLVIVDSVAALVPKAEIEGEMGDSHMGLQARLMSQALRKLTPVIGRSSCSVIFINQIREKIGVMFGNPETTTGGRALRFYASMRMEVRRIETLKKDGTEYANRVKIKLVKNKVSPPFTVGEAEIRFGEGFNRIASILETAVEHGLIQQAGSWYSYKGDKIGQGKPSAIDTLKSRPDVAEELDKTLRAKLFPLAV